MPDTKLIGMQVYTNAIERRPRTLRRFESTEAL